LAAKARYIDTRIQEANTFPKDYKIDVAIVTSSPLVELQEVLRLSDFVGEYHQDDVLHYYFSNWRNSGGADISIAACAAPVMGMTAACATACKVIERWRPRFLVMTGIAAGTRPTQNYGDVLIAEAAYDYGSGKITETENGERMFTPSYSQLRVDATLHALLQRWEREQLQTDVIRRAWHGEQRSSPRLVIGLLASGAAVVQSQALVEDILGKSRKVVGLDMEAYGIFHAAHLATPPQPKVLIAKSVSDFADKRKDDIWQQYAAFTSARFVREFFSMETGLLLGGTLEHGHRVVQ
jgi:nucleoside phosphorylase